MIIDPAFISVDETGLDENLLDFRQALADALVANVTTPQVRTDGRLAVAIPALRLGDLADLYGRDVIILTRTLTAFRPVLLDLLCCFAGVFGGQ